jgi:kynurenine 3-monooxygenase
MNPKVVLVGAGITANFMALHLKKLGYNVVVYEKSDSPAQLKQKGKSINLAYSVRGQYAIENSDIKMTDSVPMVGRLLHGEKNTKYLAYSQFGEALLSINRNEFNAILFEHAEKIGVEYHFNQCVRDIDFEKKVLIIDDVKTIQEVTYDFLIGADGSNSFVGNALDKSSLQELPVWEYIELEIDPTDDGKFKLNDPENFHIWPGLSQYIFMIALPNKDHTFTLTLFIHKDSGINLHCIQKEGDFEQFNKIITSVVKNKDELQMIETKRSFDKNKVSYIYTRKSNIFMDKSNYAALLGDALVAPSPFLGLACNAHLESSYVLANLIKRFSCSTLSKSEVLQKSLLEFYSSYMPNMLALYDASVENAKVLSHIDPDYELKHKLTQYLEKQYMNLFIEPHSMYSFKHIKLAEARMRQILQNNMLSELVAFVGVREKYSESHDLNALLKDNNAFVLEIDKKMEEYKNQLDTYTKKVN